MKGAISDNDLAVYAEGIRKPSVIDIENTIKLANAITSTIQTQVNVGKLAKELFNKK